MPADQPRACIFVFTDKTNGRTSQCARAPQPGRLQCLFHLPIAQKNHEDFAEAFRNHVQLGETLKPSETLDCKGFIFPKLDLTRSQFFGIADFRGAVFTSDIDLRGSTFYGQADFHTVRFERAADFVGVYFESSARFLGTQFHGRSIFNGSKFFAATTFHGCKFFDFAAFQGAKFDKELVFQRNEFSRDADFRSAIFYDGVDFSDTIFHNRLDFQGARFHGELRLSNAHINFLKKLECHRASLRGAVLHTTQIWENDTLTNYDFRDSFLLSVNLSGKRILNSDFTGAVFKSVLTVGWRPDRRTLENTKFVYTDYTATDHAGANGKKLRVYSPVASSRVPAEGDFGYGEHADFTLYTYLHEPARLNIALSVPPLLRTAVTNYLQLFGDFLKVTQGIPVELRTRLEGSKLRVEFLAQTEEDLDTIRAAFLEYQNSAGLDFEQLKLRINFSVNTTQIERDLFLLKMESQLNLLKTELTYTKALLSKSEEHQALLKQVSEAARSPTTLLAPMIVVSTTNQVVAEDDSDVPTLTVVFSYSHKDESFQAELEAHLSVLRRLRIIKTWYDRKLIPGQHWDPEIKARMRNADIVLLLLSADFFNSDYCFEEEMAIALQRHQCKEAVVVPIIARPCQWRETDLARIHGLPTDMRPVSVWEDRDLAWNDVVEGLTKVAKEAHRLKTEASSPSR